MRGQISNARSLFLIVGILIGFAAASLWPHDTIQAVATDRDSKFAIATATTSFGQMAEGVFLLDFLTGQLRGYVMSNKIAKFTNFYYRNIAEDFEVDPQAEPHYAIVVGETHGLPSRGPKTTASGVIYIAELTSGKLNAYAFTYRDQQFKIPPEELTLIETAQWREPTE